MGASTSTTPLVMGCNPPLAHAGADQAVTDDDRDGTEMVTLDGSASSTGTAASSVMNGVRNMPIATGRRRPFCRQLVSTP